MDLVVVIMNVFPTLVKRETSECGRHESLCPARLPIRVPTWTHRTYQGSSRFILVYARI